MKVTWEEANQHCLSKGLRLCKSQEELNRCCSQGCSLDNRLAWSSIKEGESSFRLSNHNGLRF